MTQKKKTKWGKIWSTYQPRKPGFLKHFFGTYTSPTFPQFLSEHTCIVWLSQVQGLQVIICILFLDLARFAIAHFQKEWKRRARVGARSIMGSFRAHAHLFSTSWAPKRSHNWARTYSRPSFPFFLKVGYYINKHRRAVNLILCVYHLTVLPRSGRAGGR